MKSFLEIIEEAKQGEKHAVMTFGRMNPPTTGHLKVIDKVKDVADKVGGSHHVIVSHSQDTKKNPLSGEQKVKHLKRYSPGTNVESSSKEHPSIFHHAAKLYKKGVTHLHVVVGSDRVKEFRDSINKYNGVSGKHGHYKFHKITVHSAGQRDPDTEGSEGMSGTKMREHAKNKNFGEFGKGVPAHVSDTHAKELMHDTRKGMGLHESADHGRFKAIFVTGGPGSGKDIIIREAIPSSTITELNFIQAKEYLVDKQKLSEKTNDYRREAIRNRGPLIINGPADDLEKISYIREELEELGYQTSMIFVNTTNETSKERNCLLSRMMVESIRQDRWAKSQINTKYFNESFNNFITFDNTGDLDSKEEDIHEMYQFTDEFLNTNCFGETAEDWLKRRSLLNVNSLLFKENKNVKGANKFIKTKTKVLIDNAPGQQLQRKFGKPDSVRDGDVNYNSGYTFRTYEASGRSNTPKVEVSPEAKEPNFQKDKEKVKLKKWINSASGAIKTPSLSQEYETRGQGTVYPMSGLGDVTYREQKEFSKFRKVIEAIDDPGANDMGVSGGMTGATNKEPLVTPADKFNLSGITVKKSKRKLKESHVEDLEKGLIKLNDHSYNSIDKLMQDISKKYGITGKNLHDEFKKKHGKIPDDWIKDKK